MPCKQKEKEWTGAGAVFESQIYLIKMSNNFEKSKKMKGGDCGISILLKLFEVALAL